MFLIKRAAPGTGAALFIGEGFFENGNMLARYSREKLPGEKAAENLRLFDENYITSDMVKQEVKENE